MNYVLTKEDIVEILRLWDLPQLHAALDNNILAENLVNKKTGDILLESIIRKSEYLFLRILSGSFNFDKNKFLYLHHAVRTKEMIFVKSLVEKMNDLNINKKDSFNNKTALHLACEINAQDIALYLSQKGLKWSSRDKLKQTPLHLLLRNSSYIEDSLIEEMINKDIDIDQKDVMQICCRDIIKSFSFDNDWLDLQENKNLTKKLEV